MSQLPPDQPAPPTPPTSPPSSTFPPIDYASLPGPFNFADFLTFKTMIAIPVIMVLFWVGVLAMLITGIRTMFHNGFGGFCAGVAIMLFGPFVIRLYCEFLIVVFRINETLTEIHNILRNRPKL